MTKKTDRAKKRQPSYIFLFLFLSVLLSCKTKAEIVAPPPETVPPFIADLEYSHIEAHDINKISLHYRITAENPYPQQVEYKINAWRLTINDEPVEAELTIEGRHALGYTGTAAQKSRIEKNAILAINLDDKILTEDECNAILSVNITLRHGGTEISEVITEKVLFPRIRKPEFTITSIRIMRSELINTRFRVGIKIDNPNIFPLVISSFGYELYGEGRFWASGRERNILTILPRSSAETDFYFLMNFIDMTRKLLDDIIALRQVNYLFSGDVDVRTDFPWMPVFKTTFTISGQSPVVQ